MIRRNEKSRKWPAYLRYSLEKGDFLRLQVVYVAKLISFRKHHEKSECCEQTPPRAGPVMDFRNITQTFSWGCLPDARFRGPGVGSTSFILAREACLIQGPTILFGPFKAAFGPLTWCLPLPQHGLARHFRSFFSTSRSRPSPR